MRDETVKRPPSFYVIMQVGALEEMNLDEMRLRLPSG
jgi:hypothetical protein